MSPYDPLSPTQTSAPAGTLFSIGGAAEATGLSVDTIRAWERRYGRPVPLRLPSGHRRYTERQVVRLRRIAEAIARGHRPGRLLEADDDTLSRLLDGAGSGPPAEIADMIDHVRRLRRLPLLGALTAAWREMAPPAFLEQRVVPLLVAVGRAWADGELEIRHEHFLSEVLEDALRSLRLSLPAPSCECTLVLATLPGEHHGIGLQMLALLARLRGVGAHSLGTDTPIDEIVSTAVETDAVAVLVSVSLATGGPGTDRILADLRHLLPAERLLLVGGSGARGPRRGPRGIRYLESLAELDTWLADLAPPPTAA